MLFPTGLVGFFTCKLALDLSSEESVSPAGKTFSRGILFWGVIKGLDLLAPISILATEEDFK